MFKILHISDVHIRKLRYHFEYREVFKQLYEKAREEKPDIIVNTGDTFHTKLDMSPEAFVLMAELFTNLADIAPYHMIAGNHDMNCKNLYRMDAITPVVDSLNHPNIHYHKHSAVVPVSKDIDLHILSIVDSENWENLKKNEDKINIALYHGSISGVKTDAGWTIEHGDLNIETLRGYDYGLLGDIHKTNQIVDTEGRVRYPGSLITQNFGETNDKGFLVWNIEDKDTFEVEHVSLTNPKPFVTIELTPKGKMPKNANVPNGARLRLVSNNNLPLDIMRRAVEIAKYRFKPESLTFLNRAAGSRGEADIGTGFKIENLRDVGVQEKLIREYLKDYEPSKEQLKLVYSLNRKYNTQIEESEEVARNIHWNINRFEWDNLFNYGEENSINFRNLNGIVGCFGKNWSGKSSIWDSFLYTLFNTTSKNERKNLNVINQNKDDCRGLVELQIGENVYTIERTSEKYTKKTKSGDSSEARTRLNFSSVNLATGEREELNGTTRNQTDAAIKKRFGTIEDFLMTSMSSQMEGLSFIKEGSTKRKEYLAKFLDLDIFEKKFKAAKDDSADLAAILRRTGEVNYDNDIAIAELHYDEAQKSLNNTIKKRSTMNEELAVAKENYASLTEQIDSIPVERIDIRNILLRKNELENSIVSMTEEIQIMTDEIVNCDSRIAEFDTFLTSINIEELLEQKSEYDKFKKLYEDTLNRARIMDNNLKGMSKKLDLLDEVPCGQQYLQCSFLKDARGAQEQIPPLEKGIIKEIESAKSYKAKIVSVNSSEMVELIDKYNDIIVRKNKYEILKRDNEVSIEKKLSKISSNKNDLSNTKERIVEYEEKKELIQNIEGLITTRDNATKLIEQLGTKLAKVLSVITQKNRDIGSFEQKVRSLKEKREELLAIREEYAAYDLYMRCMHSNGISYDIIKRRLPVLNDEVAKILANIVDFEVTFRENDRKLEILIKHPSHMPRPIEMGSGAEKTIGAMAIRLALLTVSSLPRGDIFILDEPATALDAENLEGFNRILQMIKSYFKTIVLISHLDSLKDIVDEEITVDNVNGFAKVNQ